MLSPLRNWSKQQVAVVLERSAVRPGLVAVQGRAAPEERQPPRRNRPALLANWRAEAWERERERELRAVDRRPDIDGAEAGGVVR